ncbi:hypothetical protein ES703_111203 [subsurface metagenome]
MYRCKTSRLVKLSNHPGVFDNQTNLKVIMLAENFFTELPPGLFDHCTKLEAIDLVFGRLQSLPDGIFNKLTNLKQLWMRGHPGFICVDTPPGVNCDLGWTYQCDPVPPGRVELIGKLKDISQLRDIPADTTELILRNNGLTSLPAGIFDRFKDLEILDLEHNHLQTLPPGIFDELTNLKILDLTYNKLNYLPAGIFDHLENLEQLSLGGNRLTSQSFESPDTAFNNLKKLKGLWLEYNPLTTIPAGWFDNLESLEDLEFFNSTLESLPPGIFDNLTHLKELDFACNKLESLPPGIFDNNHELKGITLIINRLTPKSVAGVFEKLDKLEELLLWGNPGIVDQKAPYVERPILPTSTIAWGTSV